MTLIWSLAAVLAIAPVPGAMRYRTAVEPAHELAILVRAARGGDGRAFAELYARFHRVVHAIALSRVAIAEAADVVQDVFAEAWQKLPSLREPAAFPGWITTLARRRALDRARTTRPVGMAAHEPSVPPVPRAEASAALAALLELPETYRETLIMRLVEGLTGPEIAERTGMTADSVRVHLHRGMAMLRQRLGADQEAG